MSNELLTVAQAALYLSVYDKTVRRLIASKQVTASKVGRAWRIKREGIADYLQSNTNKARQNRNVSPQVIFDKMEL